VLAAVAARHDASPFEIALAWLMDLSDLVVPLPGATRVESVQSIARAGCIALSDEDRAELDRRFPYAAACRQAASKSRMVAARRRDGDVVIIMGLPAAGKSTLAQSLVTEGYFRLNRDEAGGTLRSLLPALGRVIESGATRIVLDNTYASRKSPAEVIQAGASHGLAVRCVWLSTSIEDAQTNAVGRIVARYGRLPSDDELARLRRSDVAAFLPATQFKYRRELEPPDISEGFSRVDVVPFVRRHDSEFANRAVIVACDDVDELERLAPRLRDFHAAGYRLVGISWRPEIDEGKRSEDDVKAMFGRECERLASISTSNVVPMRPGRRDAGVASRSPASAWCSSTAIVWIPRSACTLAAALPTWGWRDVSGSSSAFTAPNAPAGGAFTACRNGCSTPHRDGAEPGTARGLAASVVRTDVDPASRETTQERRST
jgi:predicted kinase